jgi:N-acyl-D-aspartate/D-glutamate deacylase
MHDLVIRGGTVVDGTGGASRTADVAVDDGLISAVGDVSAAGARRTIDADGLLVTPGVVDVHTHYDGQVTWDPLVTPTSWHGVTTIVMGNCGVGFAPVRPGSQEWLVQVRASPGAGRVFPSTSARSRAWAASLTSVHRYRTERSAPM